MTRISFGAKILLSLILTTAALLGAALFALERTYDAKVEELIRGRIRQGDSNFRQEQRRMIEALAYDGMHLSKSQRIFSCFEEERLLSDAAKSALYEVEFHAIAADFIAILTDDGRPIARLIVRPGAVHTPMERSPLEEQPVGSPLPIGKRLIEQASPEPCREFLVDGGRLFFCEAFAILEREAFRGVVVVGRELDDRTAAQMRELQGEHDHAGFLVGDRIVASSLPADQRLLAAAALSPHLGSRREIRTELSGRPYHVVVTPIHRPGTQPLYTATFVSLAELYEFRSTMRRRFLLLGAAGLAISILLSSAISRGVTAPVRALVAGTVRIARGEYGHRVHVRSRDELGDLAMSFNRMAHDLETQEKVRGVLNKVVAPEVAEELLQGDLGLGGRLVKAALLFADLRGFTALTQNMRPEAVVAMLNEFMTAMSAEIFACKGIVDKYVGDEIIGVFGAPKSYGHDAFAAIEAAHRMRRRLEELNETRSGRGEPALAMGIGIHAGEVTAGCMGSEKLMSYTCIGPAMNLAARLCSGAKAGQILISEATLREAGEGAEVRPLDPIRVKGFDHPIAVYEVIEVAVGETMRRRTRYT